MSESTQREELLSGKDRANAIDAIGDALSTLIWGVPLPLIATAKVNQIHKYATTALDAALPHLRAQFAEEVATAIEDEREVWKRLGYTPSGIPASPPLHSPSWYIERVYESTAAIARNWGTK